MATQLEAKYRISLLLDDALKALRDFKQGLEDIKGPAGATDALNAGLDQTAAKVRELGAAQASSSAEQAAAAKASADADKEAAREKAAAAKQAAAEAAAARKAQATQEAAAAKASVAAEKEAAREKAATAKQAAAEAVAARKEQAAKEAALAKETAAKERAAAKEQKAADEAADKEANAADYRQRAIAPQLTDIVVGLSSGQSPFQVLLQQGGQLKDMFGGIVPALKAVSELFTLARVGAAALAVGVGAFAMSVYEGWQQSNELNKALLVTNNIAGVTAASLDRSARAIADNQKASLSSVREALTSAVSTGAFVGPTLDSAGRAAVALSKVTGESAADQIQNFTAMSSGVAAWAAKQNQAYNFLTASEYEHIRSLEAAGRQQEAMRDVLDKLTGAMTQRATPAVGFFAKAWQDVKFAVGQAQDALAGIGRDKTPEDRIADLQERLARVRSPNFGYNPNFRNGLLEAARQEAAIHAELDPAINLRNRDLIRQSEASIAAQNEQEKIEEQSQAYQSALAQIEQEGSRAILAKVQAGLDAKQSAVELANARGLLSAKDYSLKLNAIDQQHTQAVIDQVNRQIKIEKAQKPGSELETKTQEARVKALNNQIIDLQSKLRSESAAGRAIADQAALDEARDDAQKWASAWLAAYSQVRAFSAQNQETASAALTDPIERAEAQGKQRIATLQRQLEDGLRDLQIRIDLTVDPEQKQLLIDQMRELRDQSAKAFEDQGNAARQASLRTSWAAATEKLAIEERKLDLAVDDGAITTEQAEQRKFEARQRQLPLLEKIVDALELLARTESDVNAVNDLKLKLTELRQPVDALGDTVRGSIKSGFGSLFSDIVTGTQNAWQAFKSFTANVAKAALNVIGQRLGEQLASSLLPKSGSSGGNWLSQAGNFLTSLFTHHTGGVVGASGLPRTVGYGAIASAMLAPGGIPRYHTGGIVGYDPRSEELAVLKKGEEVLTEDDPRHVRNYSAPVGGNIGNINMSVAISGAKGDTSSLQGAGDRLGEMMRSTINQWAAEESREGGILAGRRG